MGFAKCLQHFSHFITGFPILSEKVDSLLSISVNPIDKCFWLFTGLITYFFTSSFLSFFLSFVFSFFLSFINLFFFSCLNFKVEAWWFLSIWFSGLWSSSLLWYSHRFDRCIVRPSSYVSNNKHEDNSPKNLNYFFFLSFFLSFFLFFFLSFFLNLILFCWRPRLQISFLFFLFSLHYFHHIFYFIHISVSPTIKLRKTLI